MLSFAFLWQKTGFKLNCVDFYNCWNLLPFSCTFWLKVKGVDRASPDNCMEVASWTLTMSYKLWAVPGETLRKRCPKSILFFGISSFWADFQDKKTTTKMLLLPNHFLPQLSPRESDVFLVQKKLWSIFPQHGFRDAVFSIFTHVAWE